MRCLEDQFSDFLSMELGLLRIFMLPDPEKDPKSRSPDPSKVSHLQSRGCRI